MCARMRCVFAGTCNQWDIYDEYVKDLERQRQDELMKAKGGKKAPPQQQQQASGPSQSKADQAPTMQSPQLQESLLILDRMVNQNMFEEIAMDFKYWDDTSDAFRCGSRCGSTATPCMITTYCGAR